MPTYMQNIFLVFSVLFQESDELNAESAGPAAEKKTGVPGR